MHGRITVVAVKLMAGIILEPPIMKGIPPPGINFENLYKVTIEHNGRLTF